MVFIAHMRNLRTLIQDTYKTERPFKGHNSDISLSTPNDIYGIPFQGKLEVSLVFQSRSEQIYDHTKVHLVAVFVKTPVTCIKDQMSTKF